MRVCSLGQLWVRLSGKRKSNTIAPVLSILASLNAAGAGQI